MDNIHEHHQDHNKLDDYRKHMVEVAYKHYTLPEYKIWAADTCIELAQQLSRINSETCDKEELIKNMLMTEDICCMLRMLLHKDHQRIQEITADTYCEFAERMKSRGIQLPNCLDYGITKTPKHTHNPSTNSLEQ